MDITLKQSEIEKAIHQYVSQQGINLTNKTLNIEFTSGRKENGLTAALTINDVDIPGYTNAASVADYAPVQAPETEAFLTKQKAATAPVADVMETQALPEPDPVQEPVPVAAVADEGEAKPVTTSLFG